MSVRLNRGRWKVTGMASIKASLALCLPPNGLLETIPPTHSGPKKVSPNFHTESTTFDPA